MNELDAYDFVLPPELIAQFPLKERTDARLLVVDRKKHSIVHKTIRDLPSLLLSDDTLVVNDSKVIPARLVGYRSKTGGNWEGLFLGFEPEGCWKILCKARGKLLAGESISLKTPEGQIAFPLELIRKAPDGNWIVRPKTDATALDAVERAGWVPIPPYIRGGRMIPSDKERYQTVFASQPGAIAAPTAGLHFTESLLREIQAKGVAVLPVTLHVGMGTFRPITAGRLEDHPMHSEWCCLSASHAELIRQRREAGGRTVAVGTTSVRVLETISNLHGEIREFSGETSLFIRPPYRWKTVDVLLTNFHFPKSTLYILVRMFGGDELMCEAYQEAIREKYRFFSYGDAMIIF